MAWHICQRKRERCLLSCWPPFHKQMRPASAAFPELGDSYNQSSSVVADVGPTHSIVFFQSILHFQFPADLYFQAGLCTAFMIRFDLFKVMLNSSYCYFLVPRVCGLSFEDSWCSWRLVRYHRVSGRIFCS